MIGREAVMSGNLDPEGKCGDRTDPAIGRAWGSADEESFKADKLTEAIIGGVIRVHTTLGPGYVESIYRRALVLDLTRAGLFRA